MPKVLLFVVHQLEIISELRNFFKIAFERFIKISQKFGFFVRIVCKTTKNEVFSIFYDVSMFDVILTE